MVVSLATNRLENLYADLTSQIKHSVDVIKNKSEFSFQSAEKQPLENKTADGNFAFSYLEPSTAYNIHVVSAQLTDQDKVKKEQTKQQQVNDETKDYQQQLNPAVEEKSFFEELQNQIKVDARTVVAQYQKNDVGEYAKIPLFLEGNHYTVYDSAYAAQAYDFMFNISKEADVRIEYMYKYDKSFDYRV